MNERPTPELKPCPFCGGEAEIKRKGSQRASMIIGCTDCHCELESGDVHGLTPPERLAWNRRKQDSQLAEAREALRKIVESDQTLEEAELTAEFALKNTEPE